MTLGGRCFEEVWLGKCPVPISALEGAETDVTAKLFCMVSNVKVKSLQGFAAQHVVRDLRCTHTHELLEKGIITAQPSLIRVSTCRDGT